MLLERNIISPFLASVFGGLIGQEKERKNLTAGMRAHMMVSSFGFSDVSGRENIVLASSSGITAQLS